MTDAAELRELEAALAAESVEVWPRAGTAARREKRTALRNCMLMDCV